MTRAVETTGKDVAEATVTGLRQLGISRNEADIKVLDRGRRGFLGIFGVAPARVRVAAQVSARDQAETMVGDVMSLMGFSIQLHITEEKNTLVFDIETAGADGLLIGKAGNTLGALEYLLNRMLQRENKRTPRIILDVSGYKRRREDFLKSKAMSLAEQVKSAKQQVTMEPLDADDRKVVHAVLKGISGVATRSVGSGSTKSIIVAPAAEKSGSGRRPRRRRRRS
ncbi:Jag N-terminal domain-containing protein [bacterium]|nr:Jag N-terminal domain-containing protein [bacterium]